MIAFIPPTTSRRFSASGEVASGQEGEATIRNIPLGKWVVTTHLYVSDESERKLGSIQTSTAVVDGSENLMGANPFVSIFGDPDLPHPTVSTQIQNRTLLVRVTNAHAETITYSVEFEFRGD